MLTLNHEQLQALAAAVRAADRPDIRAAVEAIYADFARELEARRPICGSSGRCCRFEEYGHRLFVTTVELATFQQRLVGWDPWNSNEQPKRPHLPLSARHHPHNACPFQHDNLCTVHAIRPFGCRVFFCDASSTEWQRNQYERCHARLREVHRAHDIPYFYVEWLQGLKAVQIAGAIGNGV